MKHLAILALALGIASPGCDDAEPFFRPCPLSSSIIEVCEENTPNTELTCVVTDHPMCDERVCAAWEGSASFCSRQCQVTEDCPPDSACLPYLASTGVLVCVPNELPEPATVAP